MPLERPPAALRSTLCLMAGILLQSTLHSWSLPSTAVPGAGAISMQWTIGEIALVGVLSTTLLLHAVVLVTAWRGQGPCCRTRIPSDEELSRMRQPLLFRLVISRRNNALRYGLFSVHKVRRERWMHLVVLFLTGVCLAWMATLKDEALDRRFSWTKWLRNERLVLVGSVRERSDTDLGSTVLLRVTEMCVSTERRPLRPHNPTSASCLNPPEAYIARVRWQALSTRQPSPGDAVRMVVEIRPVVSLRNPGLFDRTAWRERMGIRLEGEVVEVLSLQTEPNVFLRIQTHWEGRLRDSYQPSAAAFLQAFLIGSRRDLTPEVKDAFSRSGLSHIMSVSGLHVGLLLAPLLPLLPWASRRTFWRILLMAGFGMLLFFYAGLTGFRVSVNRAALMSFLLISGRLLRNRPDAMNGMATSAFVLLSLDPQALHQAGFQLSYTAVAILLVWMGPIQSWLKEKVPWKWAQAGIVLMLTSILIQFGMLPLLSSWFGQASLISPLANLAVIPLLPFLLPAAFAHLLLQDLLPQVHHTALPIVALSKVVSLGTEWVLLVAQRTGSWEGAQVALQGPSTPAVVLLFVWLAILSVLRPGLSLSRRWKRASSVLVSVAVTGLLTAVTWSGQKGVEIVYLDVGQGDAIAIHTREGRTFLIDAGLWTPHRDSGLEVLLPYLAHRNVSRIQGMFLTHPHADHIGGAPSVLDRIPVDTLYMPRSSYETLVTTRLDSIVQAKGIPVRFLQAGDHLSLGQRLTVLVLSPEGRYGPAPFAPFARGSSVLHSAPVSSGAPPAPGAPSDGEINNTSLVIKLLHGRHSFLFMGDAEKEVERMLLEVYAEGLKADVLKVGHHGSRTSSLPAFIDAVNPEHAVVQVGLLNRYALPNREVAEHFRSNGIDVYYTSLDGALTFRSNGSRLWAPRPRQPGP